MIAVLPFFRGIPMRRAVLPPAVGSAGEETVQHRPLPWPEEQRIADRARERLLGDPARALDERADVGCITGPDRARLEAAHPARQRWCLTSGSSQPTCG